MRLQALLESLAATMRESGSNVKARLSTDERHMREVARKRGFVFGDDLTGHEIFARYCDRIAHDGVQRGPGHEGTDDPHSTEHQRVLLRLMERSTARMEASLRDTMGKRRAK